VAPALCALFLTPPLKNPGPLNLLKKKFNPKKNERVFLFFLEYALLSSPNIPSSDNVTLFL